MSSVSPNWSAAVPASVRISWLRNGHHSLAGATADADLSQLNLAQKLADGQKITVPAAGETPAPADNAAPREVTIPVVLVPR